MPEVVINRARFSGAPQASFSVGGQAHSRHDLLDGVVRLDESDKAKRVSCSAGHVMSSWNGLQQNSLPLKDIGARTGLGDTSTLWRAFGQALGVTPAEYRQRFAASA
jgi:AraC-like DNA-binding protein